LVALERFRLTIVIMMIDDNGTVTVVCYSGRKTSEAAAAAAASELCQHAGQSSSSIASGTRSVTDSPFLMRHHVHTYCHRMMSVRPSLATINPTVSWPYKLRYLEGNNTNI